MLKKNDIIEIKIIDYNSEGSGVGRYNGIVIFVPFAAKGDKLRVKILKVCKNYAFGKIEEILAFSEDRHHPICDNFIRCGGCVFCHLNYEAQLKFKQKKVEDTIKRIGKINNIQVNDTIASDFEERYRNKMQFPVGTDKSGLVKVGLFASHSHRIVECEDCKLQPTIFKDILKVIKLWCNRFNIIPYDESNHIGLLRHIYIRIAEKTNQIMVCLVINGESIPHKQELIQSLSGKFKNIESIVLNINKEKTNVILGNICKTIYGKGYITDELCNMRFNISPLSFYQVNRNQAEILYNKAIEYAVLSKDDVLFDLYCGTGTIGLIMSKYVKKVIGIDIVKEAIYNAEQNAKINNVNNIEFICKDVTKATNELLDKGEKANVVVIDPPRKGCTNELIEIINKISPDKVIYISCNSGTFARDLRLFYEKGYFLSEITPIDMFPQTAHVETVVLMSRKDTNSSY